MNGAEGLLGLASAFQGFAKGVQDGEDRQYKRMEMEAKLEAQRQDKERQREMDEATNRMNLFKVREQGFLVPAGTASVNDLDMSNLQHDPQSLAMKRLAARGGAAPIKDDPFSADLRTKWLNDPTTKNTREVMAGYDAVKTAAKDPSAAGDLSLIFGYMKMVDPGSSVKEGEFANAQNSAGLSDKLRNQYNQLLNGQRLNAAQRGDFVNQARNLYKSRYANQKRFSDSIRGVAQRRGLKGEDIALDDMFLDPEQDEQIEIANDPRGLVSPVEAGNEGLLAQGAGLVKRMFMGREKSEPVQYEADVLKYAKENNITPEAAQAIKLKRTGGKK